MPNGVSTIWGRRVIVSGSELTVSHPADHFRYEGHRLKKWSATGNEIADFLSSANPNWPKKTLGEMLEKHLVTTGEVVGRLNKDWRQPSSRMTMATRTC